MSEILVDTQQLVNEINIYIKKITQLERELAMAEGLETKLHNAEQQIADLKKQVEEIVERASLIIDCPKRHAEVCEDWGTDKCIECCEHWLKTGQIRGE